MSKTKVYRSICMGESNSGTAKFLENMYAAKAYDAERARDYSLMHTYFQFSEHYKKVDKGEE